ncbi:MAG: hypothetical protein V1776_05615 [Candidatus Diapherotrites archaeon]
MLEKRRARVMKVATILFVVLGVSLVYFLFFNTGLQVAPDPDDSFGHVIIWNDSKHRIQNVSVGYVVDDTIIEIEKILFLDPDQIVKIQLDEKYVSHDAHIIHVSAPLHLSRQISIFTKKAVEDNANVQFTFVIPTAAYALDSTVIELRVCNGENFPLDLMGSFDGLSSTDANIPTVLSWSFPPNGCDSVLLPITPLHGPGTLSFKIRVFSSTRTFAERDVLMDILSPLAIQSIGDSNAA